MARRILHLDVDAEFSAAVHAALAADGTDARVRRVDTTGEVQAALEAGEWDLLLAECGPHACADLAALEELLRLHPGLPFIVLTSAPDGEAAAIALDLGAADWVAKTDLGRLGFSAERALRAARGLEALRKERDEALGAAKAAAEGAALARERFMAAVNHEIRTPLNGVASMVTLLTEMPLEPKQRQYARLALASAESLRRILCGILDFSREERGLLRLEERPFDVQEAVADAVALREADAGGNAPRPWRLVPRAAFAGLRILVAEDNEVNQVVTAGMLEALGCREVDVVGDGDEAVAAFRRKAYDLVFLDCRMPGLDGYAAAEGIRRLEAGNPPGKRCLISAMTADVVPGAEEKCRAAGMDVFLAKPFVVEEMIGVLERARSPDPENAGAAAEPPSSGPGSSGPGEAAGDLDLRILYRLRFLGEEESPDIFRCLIRDFLRQAAEKLAVLREGAGGADFRALAFAAHGLKGMCLNFGALAMARACEALQLAAERELEDGMRAALDRLEAAGARTRAAFEGILAAGAEAAPGERRNDG